MPPGFDVMDNRTEIWLPIGVHPVIRRLRENHILQVIGIRVAIGATRGSIVALVTRQGLVIVSIGLAAGLAGALGLNRLFGSLLFGVEPTDPGTLAAVTSTIGMVAVLACGLPAWRASQVDPNVVLRGG